MKCIFFRGERSMKKDRREHVSVPPMSGEQNFGLPWAGYPFVVAIEKR